MSKYSKELIVYAYDRTFVNALEISYSLQAVCINCKEIFDPLYHDLKFIEDIRGRSVCCPFCQSATVLGDASHLPITDQTFVKECYREWFSTGRFRMRRYKDGE